MSDVTTEAEELVLLIEDDDDKIEISTSTRVNGRMIPICTVETGFNEPMDGLQRRYASQIVHRFNAHGDLLEALKGIIAIADDMGGKTPAQRCAMISNAARAAITRASRAGGE